MLYFNREEVDRVATHLVGYANHGFCVALINADTAEVAPLTIQTRNGDLAKILAPGLDGVNLVGSRAGMDVYECGDTEFRINMHRWHAYESMASSRRDAADLISAGLEAAADMAECEVEWYLDGRTAPPDGWTNTAAEDVLTAYYDSTLTKDEAIRVLTTNGYRVPTWQHAVSNIAYLYNEGVVKFTEAVAIGVRVIADWDAMHEVLF